MLFSLHVSIIYTEEIFTCLPKVGRNLPMWYLIPTRQIIRWFLAKICGLVDTIPCDEFTWFLGHPKWWLCTRNISGLIWKKTGVVVKRAQMIMSYFVVVGNGIMIISQFLRSVRSGTIEENNSLTKTCSKTLSGVSEILHRELGNLFVSGD